MLDKQKHQLVQKQLLREIFSDSELSAKLVFKGGTALMMFYGLNRFSTALDFDLRSSVDDIDFERLKTLSAKQLTIRDSAVKTNAYLLEGAWEPGAQQIKIKVSRRVYPQSFILHGFLGLSIPILSPEYLLAHRLCAITSRKTLQNRDIYDADFMLKKNWQPNAAVIELRTGLGAHDYFGELMKLLGDPAVAKNIMFGLGEVLDLKEREWARLNLVESLRQQLLLRMSSTAPQNDKSGFVSRLS